MTIQHYPFQPVELPYDYDALEPFIDAPTVDIHYNKHYKGYIDKLNGALKPFPRYHQWTLKRLIFECGYLPHEIRQTVLQSAGGVLNHELYFYSMCKGKIISPFMSERISACFGSVENMENRLAEAAESVFGSGYAALIATKCGCLRLVKFTNQDTSYLQEGFPLLLIDVWEHAYYLKYTYNRKAYAENWLNLINWEFAERQYRELYGER